MNNIYLDYAGASPVDPRVAEAMTEVALHPPGNPSAVHAGANEARDLVDEARARVAALVGAGNDQRIVFTSGATESNNLALLGTAGRSRGSRKKIVISAIEHISVINAAKVLTKQGFEVVSAPVDRDGVVILDRLAELVDDNTLLVSLMYANNEIGTIEPVAKAARIAHEHGAFFHSDAAAAAGKVPIDVVEGGIDLLTISSNDLYGPPGKGALYVGPGVAIQPVIVGGGQERGLRSGTEDLPGIVGFGYASQLAAAEMDTDAARLRSLRDRLIDAVLEQNEEVHLTGHREIRVPHHASFRFDYIEGESIILLLEPHGIRAATGSACASKTLQPSHVLLALGLKHEQTHGSLVLTLGRWSAEAEVDSVIAALPPIVDRLRQMSPLAAADRSRSQKLKSQTAN